MLVMRGLFIAAAFMIALHPEEWLCQECFYGTSPDEDMYEMDYVEEEEEMSE